MLSLTVTLILLLAVEAQKNRAPVCAIGECAARAPSLTRRT